MKAQNINIQVFGMMDLLTGVFGDEAEQWCEANRNCFRCEGQPLRYRLQG